MKNQATSPLTPPEQENRLLSMMCPGCVTGFSLITITNIFFLMNGNIFNYSLASEQYTWNCGLGCDSTYAIPPAPPGNISKITGEPIFTQSYINAYNTAFNQQTSSYTKLSKGFVSIC